MRLSSSLASSFSATRVPSRKLATSLSRSSNCSAEPFSAATPPGAAAMAAQWSVSQSVSPEIEGGREVLPPVCLPYP